MDSVIWGFIGTIAGAIVGAGASIVTSLISARNSLLLQREIKSADRIGRSREFQRETIIHIQDVLLDSIQISVKAHIQDLESYNKTGTWGKNMLSDDVNDDSLQVNRKLTVLIERVKDDELRSKLKQLHAAINRVPFATSKFDSDRCLSNMLTLSDDAMEKLGTVLRHNY